MMVIAYKQGRSHRGILGIRGSLWEPPGGPTGERPHFLYCTRALWALLGQIRGLSGGDSRREVSPRGPSDKSGPERGPEGPGEAPRTQREIRGPRRRPEGQEGGPPNIVQLHRALLGQIRGLSGGRPLRQIRGPQREAPQKCLTAQGPSGPSSVKSRALSRGGSRKSPKAIYYKSGPQPAPKFNKSPDLGHFISGGPYFERFIILFVCKRKQIV